MRYPSNRSRDRSATRLQARWRLWGRLSSRGGMATWLAAVAAVADADRISSRRLIATDFAVALIFLVIALGVLRQEA